MSPRKTPRRPGLLGLILCALLLDLGIGTPRAQAQRLYWTVRDAGEIRRTCLDGSDTQVLDIPGVRYPRAIAIDVPGRKMYWTSAYYPGIWRANLDGTAAEQILDVRTPEDLAVDSAGGKIYWTTRRSVVGIWRANLDGSVIEELVSNIRYPSGIALDVGAGKMYWAAGRDDGETIGIIQRADLDGSNVETLYTTSPSRVPKHPKHLVLNPEAGHMYWTSGGLYPGVWRANLDGSNVEQIIPLGWSRSVTGFALDPNEPKLYYAIYEAPGTYRAIKKADLDGTNSTTILLSSGDVFPSGLALDLYPCGGSDCNGNGNPDDCDLCYGGSDDCNANGVPDECDITEGVSQDCNGNGSPDDCEPDCNANGVADSCDIDAGTSADCTGNGTPDECEPDCNENGVADSCDIDAGTSGDCTGNGTPDECEPDCNGNAVADSCDLAAGTSQDVNGDGRLDECAPSFCGAPEFSWVPVDASAPYSTTQPDCRGEHTAIILPAGTTGQIVEFELRINGWGSAPWSATLGAAGARLDASGLLGVNANPPQPGLDLTLLNNQPWRENSGGNGIADGAFIVTQTCEDLIAGNVDLGIPCRSIPDTIAWAPCGVNPATGYPTFCTPNPDFVFSTNLAIASVSTWFGCLAWGGVSQAGVCTIDDGVSSYYLGTFVLNIPADFVGTYTFGFDPVRGWTFMNGCAGPDILSLIRTPGHVTLQDGACCTTLPGGGTAGCTSGAYQEDCQGITETFFAGKACHDLAFECPACTVDAHCADGVFCNGAEACDVPAGQCLPGSDPCTDLETCDEQFDTCRAKGACCDRANGTCVDNAGFADCPPPLAFQEGVFLCADVPDSDGDGLSDCLDQCPGADDAVFAPECAGAIPTVSGWGMVLLTLLLMVAGKVSFRDRRGSAVSPT